MEFKLNKHEDYIVSEWSGGTTTQLGIYPEGAAYADREFIWRLSSATVDVEESDFTSLPDYNRILAVLEGEVVLAYKDIRTVKLKKLEYDYFDGAWETKSFGKITDYNLMTRKGYNGKLEVVELTEENQVMEVAPALSRGLFCTGGYAVVSFDGKSMMVGDGEQLIINNCPIMQISVMGTGALIHTEVYPSLSENEEGAGGTPEAKPEPKKGTDEEVYPYLGKGNLSLARQLYIGDFRFGKYIFKKLSAMYFDEDLDIALGKVNQFYLTFFAMLAGVVIIAMAGIDKISVGIIGLLILLWVIIDVVFVSPLIYLVFLPKPVWQHIKDVQYLNEEEKQYYELTKGKNQHLERLLKKYESRM